MKASAKLTSGRDKTAAGACVQMKSIPLPRGGWVVLVLALLLALTIPVSAQWVTVDPTFPTGSGPNGYVRTLAVQTDGQILIAGGFTNVSGSLRQYIARVGTNGVVDAGFVSQLSAEATRVQPLLDGRILISGSFTNVNGVACPGLARLQAEGTLDASFVPPSGLSASGSVAGSAGVQRHGLGDWHLYEPGRAASQSRGAIATRRSGGSVFSIPICRH